MARSNQGSNISFKAAPKFGMLLGTAIASLALAGCASSAPAAHNSLAKAQNAIEDGKGQQAVAHAEETVLADPRNAGFRAVLGASYLEAGRFQAAATAFGDAIELGDVSSRTVLSYALANIANGNNGEAIATLRQHQRVIPAADLGLALALAGQPERGVHQLVNAVRNGENSAKVRQNLAYSYALAGNWPAARVMAAEDVPADKLEARLADWASTAGAEDYQIRVANLLGVRAVSDAGQPARLALANFPSQPMMVAEAEAGGDSVELARNETEAGKAPSVETVDPTPSRAEPVRVASAAPVRVAPRISDTRSTTPAPSSAPTSAPAPVPAQAPVPAPSKTAPASTPAPSSIPAVAASTSRSAPRFVSNAVVQKVAAPAPQTRAQRPAPQRAARPAPRPARSTVATGAAATHLVQLGSFGSRAVAESKWNDFKRRFPQLRDHDVVITQARVNGSTFYRVAAAGFGRRSAQQMCNSVKSRGQACFAYAASSPPAGAVNRGVRIAARSR